MRFNISMNASEFSFEGNAYNEQDVHQFVRMSLPHLSSALHEELTALMLSTSPILKIKISKQCLEVLKDPRVEMVRAEVLEQHLDYFRRRMLSVECIITSERDQIEELVVRVLPHRSKEERGFLAREIITWNYNLPVLQEDYLRQMMHEDPELHDLFLLLTKQMTLEKFIETYGDTLGHSGEGSES